MEVFLAFTLLLIALHLGGISVTIKYLSGVRNGAGLLVGFVSAYVFSIALDGIWAHFIGGESLIIVPIVAGVAYGVGFYFAARRLVTRPIAARSAYFAIGLLALFAGFVGHRHNFAVAASMLLLSIFLPFETQIDSTSISVG
jgi:hypothetical protein